MRETHKVAIARVVIRSKEQLVAVRSVGDALGMATMLFADEVLGPERIDELADAAEVKTTKRELDVAKQLVDSLTGDFEPEKYHDTYRADVLAMIERKAQGEQIAVQPTAEEVSEPAPDLMSALKASLEAVRAREGEGTGATKAKRRKPAATKASAPKAGAPKAAGAKAASTKKPAEKKPASSRRAAAKR